MAVIHWVVMHSLGMQEYTDYSLIIVTTRYMV